MSGALAIAGVTAALKDLLNDGLLNHDLSSLGSFSVTAQAPDRINTGNNEANLLNVFNPDVVVIAGGVTQAGATLFEPLKREVRKRAFAAAVAFSCPNRAIRIRRRTPRTGRSRR